MKSTKNMLIALIAVLAAGAAIAAEPADPAATARQFIDAFNKGDLKAAEATHVAEPIIIDEMPPYQWQGRGAFKAWLDDLTKHDTAGAITGGSMKFGDVIRQEVTGDHAYVVVATDYAFKQKGAALHEPSQMTFALKKEKDGWRITGWTFAGPRPTPAS